MNRAAAIGAGAVIVASGAVLLGAFAARGGEENSPDARPSTTPVSAATAAQDGWIAARTKGSPDAPLTLYEVGDFQCSACRLFFSETLPLLQDEYIDAGKLRIIYINFPIVQIHPNAAAAHEFAMCAARQDRFWPVHDLLYEHQNDWAPLADPSTYFFGLAGTADVRSDSLAACLASGEMRALLMTEARGVFNSGIRSTPSFVLEGGLIRGAAPIDAWRPLLDSLFAEKAGG